VQQSLGARHDLDERAELLDALHLADVDAIQLRFAADVLDHVDGHLRGAAVRGEDRHLSVILDVDLGARLLLHSADHLAARSDDLPDLVRANLDGDEPRSVGTHLGARCPDGLRHLAEHVQPRLARLGQRLPHDVDRDAADLDVHLQRGDPLLGAGDLEVHVTVVILAPHDVGEDADLVALLDQSHRDARHGSRERHARVHERHGGPADAGHRRRAIGLEDLGHDADGVWKDLPRRHHRLDRPLGQRPMADLAAARSAEALDLAGGERREVVMEHEAAEHIALERLQLLLVILGAKRRRHERLSLAPGKEGGPVDPRQIPDLGPDGAHLGHPATVQADPLLHDHATDFGLLDLLERLAGLRAQGLVHAERGPHFIEHAFEGLRARLLLVDREGLDDLGGGQLLHASFERGIRASLGVEGPLGLARLSREVLLDACDLLALLVAEGERFEHLLLADLAPPGLDHENRVFRAGDDDLERRGGELFVGRVGHKLALDEGHPHRADRRGERDPGQGHRRG
jgi:hypothetical protein